MLARRAPRSLFVPRVPPRSLISHATQYSYSPKGHVLSTHPPRNPPPPQLQASQLPLPSCRCGVVWRALDSSWRACRSQVCFDPGKAEAVTDRPRWCRSHHPPAALPRLLLSSFTLCGTGKARAIGTVCCKVRGIILSQRRGGDKQRLPAGGSGRRLGTWKRKMKTPRHFSKAYMRVI